jgi:hypothetical protein
LYNTTQKGKVKSFSSLCLIAANLTQEASLFPQKKERWSHQGWDSSTVLQLSCDIWKAYTSRRIQQIPIPIRMCSEFRLVKRIQNYTTQQGLKNLTFFFSKLNKRRLLCH